MGDGMGCVNGEYGLVSVEDDRDRIVGQRLAPSSPKLSPLSFSPLPPRTSTDDDGMT